MRKPTKATKGSTIRKCSNDRQQRKLSSTFYRPHVTWQLSGLLIKRSQPEQKRVWRGVFETWLWLMNFSIRIEVHLRSIRGRREIAFLPQLRDVVAAAAVVVVVEFLLRRVVQRRAVVQQERGCCCCCFKEFSEPRLLQTSVWDVEQSWNFKEFLFLF